jgi:sugar/nucleoside kinase (ribokinase family)
VLLSLLARVDLVVINEEEARQLTGEHHIAKVARALRAIGPKHAIVKRGEYGAMLFGPDGVFSAAGYPLESVIDPTGAGDCFAGGLLGYLAHQGEITEDALRRAVVYGSAIASFDVEGVGPSRLFDVTADDVRARVADFRKMVAFEA